MKKIYILLIAVIAAGLSVNAQKHGAKQSKLPQTVRGVNPAAKGQTQDSFIPKAVIYTMNGDWSQYVPVNVTEDGATLISFPAPSDIKAFSTPVNVGDGYWLDRRGIGPNTVFTRWTYAEYSQLPTVPAPDEILDNIIPGARVTEILELPLPASVAAKQPSKIRQLVADGLQGAVIVYRSAGNGRNADTQPAGAGGNDGEKGTVLRGEPGPRPTILTGAGKEEPVCR